MKYTVFLMLLVFYVSCKVKNGKTTIENEIINCESFEDFVEVNAVQKKNFLFNQAKQVIFSSIDSIAQITFIDSIEYLSNYSFEIEMDSLGSVISIKEKQNYGVFGNKIIEMIKAREPLNPPYFKSNFTELGIFESSVEFYIMFNNNNSSHFNLDYSKARVTGGKHYE